MSFVGSLTEQEQQVALHLPYPIAAAWHEVLLARGAGQIEQKLLICIDVVSRQLGVLALCDYLRGAADPAVEGLLQRLEHPKPEDWLALLQACCRAIAQRTTPAPFAPPLLAWTVTPRGEQAVSCALLAQTLALRDTRLRDTMAESAQEDAGSLQALGRSLLSTLESLRWLTTFRLVRVTALTTLRHRGFHGLVQVFAGGTQNPKPFEASWSAHVLADVVYWLAPRGDAWLELSPFMRVLPDPKTRRPLMFLFDRATGLRRLQLASDAADVQVETAIAGPDGEMGLHQWLQVRNDHGAFLENDDIDGSLALDPRDPALAGHARPKSKPVPNLRMGSSYRPASDRVKLETGAFGDRPNSRWLLALQIAVLVIVSGVAVRLMQGRAHPHGTSVAADAPAAWTAPRVTKAKDQAPAAVAVAQSGPALPKKPGAKEPPSRELPKTTKDLPPLTAAARTKGEAGSEAAHAEKPFIAPKTAQPAPTKAVAASAPPPAKVAVSAAPAKPAPPQLKSAAVAEVHAPSVPAGKVDLKPAAKLPAPVADRGGATDAAGNLLPPSGDFVKRGEALLELRPSLAALVYEEALEAGLADAHLGLAKVYQRLGQMEACRVQASRALRDAPGDARVQAAAARCGGALGPPTPDKPSTPADKAALTNRLFQEGFSIIYGARHSPAERRKMAKQAFADAARRGNSKGWLALAKIYLLGELDKPRCAAALRAYREAGGSVSSGEAKDFSAKCNP